MIEQLKAASGHKTAADVIRNALALYEWARRENEAGRVVGSFQEGRPVREVLLPFITRKP